MSESEQKESPAKMTERGYKLAENKDWPALRKIIDKLPDSMIKDFLFHCLELAHDSQDPERIGWLQATIRGRGYIG